MRYGIYTHVLNRGGRAVHSPLGRLRKPVSSKDWGIVPAGRHKTGKQVVGQDRSRYKQVTYRRN